LALCLFTISSLADQPVMVGPTRKIVDPVNFWAVQPTDTNFQNAVKLNLTTNTATITNYGYKIAKFGSSQFNTNYLLMVTNAGQNAQGYAVFTNVAFPALKLIFNQNSVGSTPAYTLVSNNAAIWYDNSGEPTPFSGWESRTGNPTVGTVSSLTNVVVTTQQSVQANATLPLGQTAPFAAGFTNNVLWLDPNGSDATARRGDSSHPFATLEAAQAASRPGDAYILFPGTYTMSFNWSPTNAVVIANGAVISQNAVELDGAINDVAIAPVGNFSLIGGVITNYAYPAGRVFALAQTTNFLMTGTRVYSSTVIFDGGVSQNISSNLVFDLEDCYLVCADFYFVDILAPAGRITNTVVRLVNNTFADIDFGNNYIPISVSFIHVQNVRLEALNNQFDFSRSHNVVLSNSTPIFASNSVVHLSGNDFQAVATNGVVKHFIMGNPLVSGAQLWNSNNTAIHVIRPNGTTKQLITY